MNIEFESKCTPSYRFLTEEQINRFHKSTLELLGTIGVKVMHPEALDMLDRAGCQVKNDQIVLIPSQLIEDAIRSAPSRIVMYDRMGREAMDLQGRNIHFGLGTDLAKRYDLKTGEMRQSERKDVATAARIADACEEMKIRPSMMLASEQLERNQPQFAIPHEKTALEKLKELQAKLEEARAKLQKSRA